MIGAGNVSTHISRHLHSAGHRIACIFSRSRESAERLAGELDTLAAWDPDALPRKADFYIICVPDHAVAGVAADLKGCKGLLLHTAGAVSMEVLEGPGRAYGVLYPLQTLSRERDIPRGHIPFLVEASSSKALKCIKDLAFSISEKVEASDSKTRLMVHLAAVFANNFSNHMVHLAQQIMEMASVNPQLLGPLLEETFQKLRELDARSAQTGPAVRGDSLTMNKHRELLKDHPELEKLYTFISRDIESSRE